MLGAMVCVISASKQARGVVMLQMGVVVESDVLIKQVEIAGLDDHLNDPKHSSESRMLQDGLDWYYWY